MALNKKPGYYDALVAWCDIGCSNAHVLRLRDGRLHCHDRGRQVDFQNDASGQLCSKCPYGTEWKWELESYCGDE